MPPPLPAMTTSEGFTEHARKWLAVLCVGLSLIIFGAAAAEPENQSLPAYQSELNIAYAKVDGRQLTLNAFLPADTTSAVPAIVEIHGGWWFGGEAASKVDGVGG